MIFSSVRKAIDLLGPRERRNGAILFGLMLVAALFEVIGVAAIPGFIGAILSPERFEGVPVLGDLAGAGDNLGSVVLIGAIALFVIYALKNAFLILNFWLQIRWTTHRRVEFASRLLRAYLRAPYTFHLERNTSELLRNVDQEATRTAYSVFSAVLEVSTRVVILVAVLALLFVVEPWITLYWAAIFGSLGALGYRAASARLSRFGKEEQRERARFVQALFEGLGTVKEARVLGRTRHFERRTERSLVSIAAVNRFKQLTGRIVSPITETIAVAGLLGLMVVLVLLGRSTDEILVTMSLFVVGLVRVRETLNAMMTRLAALRYDIVSLDVVHAELTANEGKAALPPPAPEAAGPLLTDRIAVEDVSYRFRNADRPSLEGINLTVARGEAVGLVGATGAGKSTLVDIILGLLDPAEGAVTVDGRDIREIGIGVWQRRIGYVPQAITLTDDTIRRNIALGLGDAEIDEARIATAIEKAQLGPFLSRQPEGLDTVIGERGVRISGGERQRIGIARALYHDPEVIVLDEATSALDGRTERAVIEAVEAFRGDRTIIMIAHRLSTVKTCDRLYFLKEGRIEASGTYDELVDRSADFGQMARAAE